MPHCTYIRTHTVCSCKTISLVLLAKNIQNWKRIKSSLLNVRELHFERIFLTKTTLQKSFSSLISKLNTTEICLLRSYNQIRKYSHFKRNSSANDGNSPVCVTSALTEICIIFLTTIPHITC